MTAQTAWFPVSKGEQTLECKKQCQEGCSNPAVPICQTPPLALLCKLDTLFIILSKVTIMTSTAILLKKLCFSAKFLAWGWAFYSFLLLLSNHSLSPNLAMLWEQLYIPLLTDTSPDKQHYPRTGAKRRGAVQLNATPTLGHITPRK